MYFPGFDVDARFARQFDLGVRGFRYANPRKSIFPRPFSDEQLGAISVPTLLLIGDRERIYDPHKALERAARLVPRIETDLVPGAGHILAMQLPDIVGERNARVLVAGWLRGRPLFTGEAAGMRGLRRHASCWRVNIVVMTAMPRSEDPSRPCGWDGRSGRDGGADGLGTRGAASADSRLEARSPAVPR
jgi:hypothetical protein